MCNIRQTVYNFVFLIVLILLLLIKSRSGFPFVQFDQSVFFIFCTGLLWLILSVSLWKGRLKRERLSIIDGVLLLLLGYGLLNSLVFQEGMAVSSRWYDLLGLGMFYLLLRWGNIKTTWLLLIVPVLGGLVQVIYGELQLYGFYPSMHSGFPVTGSFFNPGPYAGFLAVVFPAALGLYFFMERKEAERSRSHPIPVTSNLAAKQGGEEKVAKGEMASPSSVGLAMTNGTPVRPWVKDFVKYLSLAAVLGILLVLPAANSRAAWLAVIFSAAFLAFFRYRWDRKLFRVLDSKLKKGVAAAVLFGVIGVGLLGIYLVRQDSADGRLLIWKASLSMIGKNPLFGIGFDSFRAAYMEEQASYFQLNPDDPAIPLANNVVYAFNEGIQLLVEQGIIGLGLVLIVIWLAFSIRGSKEKPEIWIAQTGLLSLLVFGMFSYPSHILPIKLYGVLYLAILAGHSRTLWRLGPSGKPVRWALSALLLALSVGSLWQAHRLYRATSDWKEALAYYQRGASRSSLQRYEKAYPVFLRNGEFLCNYGKALSVAGEHAKAVIILEEAKNHLSNTIIQTALGDSYQALGMYREAEQAYQLGVDMLPDRYYARYLLAKLYEETGQEDKWIPIARYLVEKQPKVPSRAVEEIREEMLQLIREREIIH